MFTAPERDQFDKMSLKRVPIFIEIKKLWFLLSIEHLECMLLSQINLHLDNV